MYEEFYSNPEVYDITTKLLEKLNLKIYEYNESIFITPGEENKIFGYTNDEMKKVLGLKINKELYLVYFIIYNILLEFYNETSSFIHREYVKVEEIIKNVNEFFLNITNDISVYSLEEIELDSFKTIALLWDDLPMITSDLNRASKASRIGYVKLTFNFLVSQSLFVENQERYYPTSRFHGIVTGYFEEYKGKIHSALGGNKNA